MDQLYCFRDSYFETHSVEDAGRKHQDVQDKMEKTLQQMEEVLGMNRGAFTPLPFTKCGSAVLWTVWYPACGCCRLAQSIAMPLGG